MKRTEKVTFLTTVELDRTLRVIAASHGKTVSKFIHDMLVNNLQEEIAFLARPDIKELLESITPD